MNNISALLELINSLDQYGFELVFFNADTDGVTIRLKYKESKNEV